MLTWEYPPRIVGGIARVVHDLSKRMIKDGHEVTVITYRDGDLPEYENDKGVEVYRVNNYMIQPNNFIDWIMQLNFNMIAKATELINKEGKFDVIHAHDWLVASAAKTLKNSFDMPFSFCGIITNFSTYFPIISVSKLTSSPIILSFKTVASIVCGIAEIEKLSLFTSATVRLIPSIAIEPFCTIYFITDLSA